MFIGENYYLTFINHFLINTLLFTEAFKCEMILFVHIPMYSSHDMREMK